MKRSFSTRSTASILPCAALLVVACSSQPEGVSGQGSAENLGVQSAAEKVAVCDDGRCNHGETCSTCPQNCDQCTVGAGGAGGSDGTGGTGGSAGGAGGSAGGASGMAGGSGGTGGSGGGTGVCGSTAAPPATYQHIVIFSFENRTWS